jgi:hypothetical protein
MPRQLIKVGPSKGLDRKQIAPAFVARARLVSSGKAAVMKMSGARLPRARIIVKTQSAHAGHLQIRNQARRVVQATRLQEVPSF